MEPAGAAFGNEWLRLPFNAGGGGLQFGPVLLIVIVSIWLRLALPRQEPSAKSADDSQPPPILPVCAVLRLPDLLALLWARKLGCGRKRGMAIMDVSGDGDCPSLVHRSQGSDKVSLTIRRNWASSLRSAIACFVRMPCRY